MPINLDINFDGLDNLSSRFDSGRVWAGNQAMVEMDEFVPKREGYLRDSATLSNDGKTITYHEPYSRPQFYGVTGEGYQINNYTTPGTGKRWDLRLQSDDDKMANVKKAFVEGAKLNGSS